MIVPSLLGGLVTTASPSPLGSRDTQTNSGHVQYTQERSIRGDRPWRCIDRRDDGSSGRPGCADDQSRRTTSGGAGRCVATGGWEGSPPPSPSPPPPPPPTQGAAALRVLPSESRQPATRVLLPSFDNRKAATSTVRIVAVYVALALAAVDSGE